TLTWEQCVREAVKKNPDLGASHENFQSASDRAKGARSGFFPQVSAELDYRHGDQFSNRGLSSLTSQPGKNLYSTSLSVTQNLFAGFQDQAKVRRGVADRDAARMSLEEAKAQASYDLKSAFARLQYAQSAVQVTKSISRRREENLKLIELRYE